MVDFDRENFWLAMVVGGPGGGDYDWLDYFCTFIHTYIYILFFYINFPCLLMLFF